MTVDTSALRILLVDDHTLFRTGLSRLLGEDPRVEVVGQAADGNEALTQTEKLKPDVVLMDLKMPNLGGVEATRQMVAADPAVKIVILTTFETDEHLTKALKAGASGYVLKDSELDGIVTSLLAVANGQRVMSRTVVKRVLEMISNGSNIQQSQDDGLTPREVEILRLVAAGNANRHIAHLLGISHKTVSNHIGHMYMKLGVVDRSQAVAYATRNGLVDA